MRIAINALSAVAGGGVTYLNQLFKHLSVNDRKNEYLIITIKKGKKALYAEYKNFCVLPFKIPSLSIVTRLLWEQLYLWYILKEYKADVLYSPANIGLIFQSFSTIVMIQTVAPLIYTHECTGMKRNSVWIQRNTDDYITLPYLKTTDKNPGSETGGLFSSLISHNDFVTLNLYSRCS